MKQKIERTARFMAPKLQRPSGQHPPELYQREIDGKTLEENHYYPYGLKHVNYNSSLQEWGNKEEQPEQVVVKAPPVNPGGTVESI